MVNSNNKKIDLNKYIKLINSKLKKYWQIFYEFFHDNPAAKKSLLRFSGILIFIFLFFSTFLFQVNHRFNPKEVIFKIGLNEATTYISYNLKRHGIVSNIIGFRLFAKLFRIENKFHAGEYKLSAGMNLLTILNTLQEKGALSLTSGTPVTIPEGFSIIEIAEILEQKGVCSSNDFKKLALYGKASDVAQKYDFVQQIPIDSLEGYLFPDTYILPQNASANIVLDIMLRRFAKAIKRYRKEITSNDLSLHQLITLASLVEKEAVLPEEREIISGIFRQRLKYRMYLGSCPTVKYAMGKPRLPYLLYKHLDTWHPYNTYRHTGLPPGPIASPGIASIKAAIRPEQTKYLYFVSKGDGSHIFTESHEKHLKVQGVIKKETGGKIY